MIKKGFDLTDLVLSSNTPSLRKGNERRNASLSNKKPSVSDTVNTQLKEGQNRELLSLHRPILNGFHKSSDPTFFHNRVLPFLYPRQAVEHHHGLLCHAAPLLRHQLHQRLHRTGAHRPLLVLPHRTQLIKRRQRVLLPSARTVQKKRNQGRYRSGSPYGALVLLHQRQA